MKYYTTGVITTTVTAISLLTRLWLNQGFDLSNPWLFWGVQFLFIVYYIIRVTQTFINWKPVGKLTKSHLVCSMIVEFAIYALGFTHGKYGGLFIFLCGIMLAAITRYRAGLVETKSYA